MKKRNHHERTAGNGRRQVLRPFGILVFTVIIAFSHPAITFADADTVSAAEIPEEDGAYKTHSPEAHEACIRDTERQKYLHTLPGFESESVVEGSEEEAPEIYDESSDKDSSKEEVQGAAEPLPEQYSSVEMGYITPVKDQSYFGCCWAFATVAAVEASVLRNNVLEGMTKDSLDLSERHLVYFGGYTPPDPLGNTDGDKAIYPDEEGEVYWDDDFCYLNCGGNDVSAFQRLGAYFGLVEESVAPFKELVDKYEEHYRGDGDFNAFLDETKLDNTYENACERDILHLTAVHEASWDEADKIKQLIMDYGAVSTGVYFHPSYINYDNYALYVPQRTGYAVAPNHSIILVGWDDRFSRNNFGNFDTWTDSYGTRYKGAGAVPEHDGAWLVKNSYGSEWGLDGYFWLSYDYCYESENIYACEAEPADSGWHVYMHDGGMHNSTILLSAGSSIANVYKVPDDAQHPQLLEKVSFSLFNLINASTWRYELQVYRNPTDAADPTSGTPMFEEPVAGSYYCPAFCFVELPEPVILDPGDTYALVFTFDDYFTAWIDASFSEDVEYVSSYEEGESFLKWNFDDTWTDCTHRNYNKGAFRIRGYTLDAAEPEYAFSDVQDSSHPYFKAIYWAADAGITKGYADGTFGINKSCTRGEMIMFLWRFAREPAPKKVSKSPFRDVPTTHSFYKAVLWAYQKGITKGYSNGTFGIDRNVSRGECMMFLWRIKGKPAPKAVSKSPFRDVPKTHTFYNAILWGSQKGITKGYTSGARKGEFGINDNCTRGQIVTFLYRAN